MTCREIRAKLTAYLDNELTGGGEDAISQHLAVCGDCQRVRREFLLSRKYLHRLRVTPDRFFSPDIKRLLEPIRIIPQPNIPLRVAVAGAVVVIAVFGLYHLLSPPGPIRLQVPLSNIVNFVKQPAPEGAAKSAALEKHKEIFFDTASLKIVSVGKDSWVGITGKSSFYHDGHSLRIKLLEGSLTLALDDVFKTKTTVTAGCLNISTLGTEFVAELKDSRISVGLLSGKLLLNYKDGETIKVARLMPGYGVSGTVTERTCALKTHKLLSSQSAALSMKLDRIREIGAWQQKKPAEGIFQSGGLRIEFWKGE